MGNPKYVNGKGTVRGKKIPEILRCQSIQPKH